MITQFFKGEGVPSLSISNNINNIDHHNQSAENKLFLHIAYI